MTRHHLWQATRAELLRRMTPEQRAQALAATTEAQQESDDDYIFRFDGVPIGPLFPEGFGAVLGEILCPTPVAEQDGPPWTHHFPAPAICGHCRKSILPHQRAFAGDVDLRHTGTIPPDAEPADCYRLVTVLHHAADGSCCQKENHSA